MKLRGRLLTAFFLCGLVPTVAISALNIWNASSGCRELTKDAAVAIEDSTAAQLVAIRDIKGQSIQEYFKFISDQVQTMSGDRQIVDAVQDFKSAFASYG